MDLSGSSSSSSSKATITSTSSSMRDTSHGNETSPILIAAVGHSVSSTTSPDLRRPTSRGSSSRLIRTGSGSGTVSPATGPRNGATTPEEQKVAAVIQTSDDAAISK